LTKLLHYVTVEKVGPKNWDTYVIF
jgi:hypothetical protein